MDTNSQKDNLETSQTVAALMAGLGGSLPTLCKIAAASSSTGIVAVFTAGHISAIGLYFVISLILCLGLAEKRRREAFILGIAAPAIISSFLSGISERGNHPINFSTISLISPAYAQASPTDPIQHENDTFWTDFKRGIGVNVDKDITGAKLEEAYKEIHSLESKIITLKKRDKELLKNLKLKSKPDRKPRKLQIKQKKCPDSTNRPVQQEIKYIETSAINYNVSINDPNWKLLIATDIGQLYNKFKVAGVYHNDLKDLTNRLLNESGFTSENATFWEAISNNFSAQENNYRRSNIRPNFATRNLCHRYTNIDASNIFPSEIKTDYLNELNIKDKLISSIYLYRANQNITLQCMRSTPETSLTSLNLIASIYMKIYAE